MRLPEAVPRNRLGWRTGEFGRYRPSSRQAIAKEAGDTVTILLEQRLDT